MTQQELNCFKAELLTSLEDSNFLSDVYNDLKLEEENFTVRDLNFCKKIILSLGYKIEVRYINDYHGKRAVIVQ
jgi:hypothetical protein